MPYPAGLHVDEHPPQGGWDGYHGPVVILVHGSLDRGASFRRTIRRLPQWGFVTYDRRGYQGSRPASPGVPPADFGRHIDDLLGVAAYAAGDPRSMSAVGHSVGGDIVVGAALAEPHRFASIGAFEPPMPWLGFRRDAPGGGGRVDPGEQARRWPTLSEDPGVEAEQFFRRMVGDGAWDRLPESMRRERRADGPALVADLLSLRGPAPFDVTALSVPVVFGRSDSPHESHHHRTVAWLADHVAGSEVLEINEAGHGAHLSHPDAFAEMVRHVVRLGGSS